MGIQTLQNFMLISELLRKMWKICSKNVIGKKSVQKGMFVICYSNNLQKHSENNFFWVPFSNYFRSCEILRILDTLCKKC
jgi:hypothetical protein